MTSGTRANGMPNDSTTWEKTSACVTSTPTAITASAGARVTSRRTTSGIRRRRKPCMTTWPESVPTPDAAKPEASSASANSIAAVGPSAAPSPAWARLDRRDGGREPLDSTRAATTSMMTLTAPARVIAATTSSRWLRSRPSRCSSVARA